MYIIIKGASGIPGAHTTTTKLDSGAIINLAHQKHCNYIKNCSEYNLPPIKLSGIGGQTEALTKVGKITALVRGQKKTAFAYIMNEEVAGTKEICLLGLKTLIQWDVDLTHHMRDSLVGITSALKLNHHCHLAAAKKAPHKRKIKRSNLYKAAQQGHVFYTSGTKEKGVGKEAFAGVKGILTGKTKLRKHLKRLLSFSEARATAANLKPFANSPPTDSQCAPCTCELRVSKPLGEEEMNILMAESLEEETSQNLMSEIQIRAIVDRTSSSSANEGTDGASTMQQGEETISKFSREAMVLGRQVKPGLRKQIYAIYQEHCGHDKVFPLKNGPPKILEMYKNKPYNYELREEFKNGSLPLPSVKAFDWSSKPATSKIIRDFIKSTPVVSPCANPRCISRLVIVPKLDPGQSKDATEHGFRVTVNALFNKCLKPAASTIPLATSEIKKLHGNKFFLQIDGLSAFWSIPVGEESKRLTAFHTPEGIFCWDRLLMGARPSSAVQQAAYLKALDDYVDSTYLELYPDPKDRCGMGNSIRHKFASYCDDLAAGAQTLEQLYILFRVLIITCAKAGIQVKASKAKFGVEEITFHNFLINSETTKPKQANLCPIRNMGIPRDVHQVRAFLGMCQQLANYVSFYAIIAAPLHALTKSDGTKFPRPWVAGSAYDVAFHRLKAAMLDSSRFLWHKDKRKRLFIECDASDLGFGAAAFQYEHPIEATGDDEGVARLKDNSPKRVVEWMSKAWTTDQLKLPVFYRESLARLIVLEKFRNLIESNIDMGVTVYTDHLPSLFKSSLSNKGQLSEWRINEVQDLNSVVQTLYKKGPTMVLSDALSRCCQPETDLYDNDLPKKLALLLDRLPEKVRNVKYMRVNANKDTQAARRIVQRWRRPKNPVSPLAPLATSAQADFIIGFPLDKGTTIFKTLLERGQPCAMLLPLSVISRIPQDPATGNYLPGIQKIVNECPKIVISALNLAWVIYLGPKDAMGVVTTEVLHARNSDGAANPTGTKPGLTHASETIFEEEHHNENFGCNKDEAYDIMNHCIATSACLPLTRSAAKAEAESTARRPENARNRKSKRRRQNKDSSQKKILKNFTHPESAASKQSSSPNNNLAKNKNLAPLKTGTYKDAVQDSYALKGKLKMTTATTTAPDPISTWVGQQLLGQKLPADVEERYLKQIPNQHLGLCGVMGDHGQPRIIVPVSQQKRLLLQTHEDLLHQDHSRVHKILRTIYYWPGMEATAEKFITKCQICQFNKNRRLHLKSSFVKRGIDELPLPRQQYGFDFYGVPKGEILVIVDLCTRETTLVFMSTRDQDKVAQAILNNVIFLKGVPTVLRSDSAPELVAGIVRDINKYLGISQVQTGGYNPRGNAICERANQTIGAMLRKCEDRHYKNVKNYLPAMAFAMNCTHSDALNCTPFEAGHGLPARTIAQARAHSAQVQFRAGGNDDMCVQDISKKFDASIHKDTMELATQMWWAAQQESEYQRKLTSERLNQAGKKISTKAFNVGDEIYFYKPPSQEQALAIGRKVKHMAHYHGPAVITESLGSNSYKFSYEGKAFQRDAGMIFKYFPMPADVSWTDERHLLKPSKHKSSTQLWPGEFLITKDDEASTTWYVAQVAQVLPDRVRVNYYTTITPPLEDYNAASPSSRLKRLNETTFQRTWCLELGRGKATTIPPKENRREKDLYRGDLPSNEWDNLFLIRNVALQADGRLDDKSAKLAAELHIPHHQGAGGDDNFEYV